MGNSTTENSSSKAHELVLSGGTIVDGTGAASFAGDIGIDNGVITAVGGKLAGDRVIDAAGAVVAPGWVDVHTHYDGQAAWDDTLDPSFSNGVTTLVMGNCGVGFAPCPPGGEQALIELMEGVEDIPGTALHEGVPWGEWTTFPEYLDFLDRRSYSMDIAAQIAHGSLRFAVMGERGIANSDASAEDIAEMQRQVAEATAAGAVGFSTSRTIFHRSINGDAVPGTYASAEELTALVQGLADGGGGVFEAIMSESIGAMEGLGGERFRQSEELELLANISTSTGQPVTFTTVQNADWPDAWREVLDFVTTHNADGAQLFPQVASRPIGLLASLGGYHPFMQRTAYLEIAHLPVADQAKAMRDPELRRRILADDDVAPADAGSMATMHTALHRTIPMQYALDQVVDYEPGADKTFAAIAAAAGVSHDEAMYDFLTDGDGSNVSMLAGAGYVKGNLDDQREMLVHPHTIAGLADAGAHVKLICDGTMPTSQLTHWCRDRSTGQIPIETLIAKQTGRNAALYGFDDRGTLEVGKRADINIIDLDNLAVHRPEIHDDLPAGGRRYLQPVKGYAATFVAGVQTRFNDTDTGERPGQLVRT